MKQLKQLRTTSYNQDKVVCDMNIPRLFKIGGEVKPGKLAFMSLTPPPILAVPERDSI